MLRCCGLEQEGLLERLPKAGHAVRQFSFVDVADAIELRGVMEGTAARLAAERGAPTAGLDRLHDLLGRLDEALEPDPERMDFDAYVATNAAFHEVLAGLAGSEVVRREVERAAALPFASPSAFLRGQRDVAAVRRSLVTAQAQHRALVEAIGAREGARAEAIAREHARLAHANLRHVMGQDRSLRARVPGLMLVTP